MFTNGEDFISQNIEFQKNRDVEMVGFGVFMPFQDIIDSVQEEKLDDLRHYEEVLKLYKEYIRKVSSLCTKLVPEESDIDLSILISKLIYRGLFSYGDRFDPKNEYYKPETTAAFGLNVLNGNACCRHVSNFQKDVFDILNKYSRVLTYLLSEDKGDHVGETADHAINIIRHSNNLMGYDVLNNRVFNFTSESQLENPEYQGVTTYYLNYKPYIEYMLNNISEEEVARDLDRFNEASKVYGMNYVQFANHQDFVENSINERYDFINDFHKENVDLRNEIVLSFKNRSIDR